MSEPNWAAGPAAQPVPTSAPGPRVPKPRRRWLWAAGIVAAFFVGLGAGSTTAVGTERDTAAPAPRTVTVTAPPPAPQTYTRTAPAPVTVTAEPPAPVTVTAEPGPTATLSNGVYEVGVDVQPGRYKTDGPTGSLGMCFWSRNKNDSGDFDAIITNGIVEGPGSLTINAGEFVEISGDCAWNLVG